jgi:hypothetical protein
LAHIKHSLQPEVETGFGEQEKLPSSGYTPGV